MTSVGLSCNEYNLGVVDVVVFINKLLETVYFLALRHKLISGEVQQLISTLFRFAIIPVDEFRANQGGSAGAMDAVNVVSAGLVLGMLVTLKVG